MPGAQRPARSPAGGEPGNSFGVPRKRAAFAERVAAVIPLPRHVREAFLIPLGGSGRLSRAAAGCHRDAGAIFPAFAGGPGDPRNIEQAHAALLALLNVLFGIENGAFSAADLRSHVRRWSVVADQYGFWKLGYLIQDAAMKKVDPECYRIADALLRRSRAGMQQTSLAVMAVLGHYLRSAGIGECEICFRAKNVAGVCEKIKRKGKSLNHITDLFGFRVIAPSIRDCYRTVEIIHRLWRPYPEHFRDYIRAPKENGYRSLHTIVHCLGGRAMEFQVRTAEMDWIAKYGEASHALYKAGMPQGPVA